MITTTFTSTHDINLRGCGESIAAANDVKIPENMLPFAFCSHIGAPCKPQPFTVFDSDPWLKTARFIQDSGERVLTEESHFHCATGGMAKVEFVDPGQNCIYIGDIKPLRELLEERGELIANSDSNSHLRELESDRLQALDNEILSRIPYNQVQFTSSHNSYSKKYQDELLIKDQIVDYNIHSVELDFHLGNPDRGLGHSRPKDDFCVYHSSIPGDASTNYDDMDEYKHDPWWTNGCVKAEPLLNEIKNARTNHQPITVFIDLKALPLQPQFDGQEVDDLITRSLGDKLYSPAHSISDGGSPSMLDMQNKITVVLTDATGNYEEYFSEPGSNPAAFVAQTDMDNIIQNPSSMIFYNTKSKDLDESVIAEIQANNGLLRTYGYEADNYQAGVDYGTNFLGVDHVKEEWNDLSEYGFPFKIKEAFLMLDEHQTMGQEGKLAVTSGATLTCPKAVHPADVKFFRLKKLFS